AVGVAPGGCPGYGEGTGVAQADQACGGRPVTDCGIAAVERRAPSRAPEVLIRRVDAPGCGQLKVGRLENTSTTESTAIDGIAEKAPSRRNAIRLTPVRVGGLEDVLQSTFGIVDLRLEVVADGDKRRVDLYAAANHPTDLGVRMTACGQTASDELAGTGRIIVERVDVVDRTHDLGRAPSLIDA